MLFYMLTTQVYLPLSSLNVALNGNNFIKQLLLTNINKQFNKIQEWLNINKLFYQVGSLIPDVKVNNLGTEMVSEFNFLGLRIDEYFSWNGHIRKISNKVVKSIGILKRFKPPNVPPNILRTLHMVLILTYLPFSVLNLSFKPNRITWLLNRAVHVIANSQYSAHVEPHSK